MASEAESHRAAMVAAEEEAAALRAEAVAAAAILSAEVRDILDLGVYE